MYKKLAKTAYLRGVYNGKVRYMRIYRPRSKDGHIEVFTPGLGEIYHHGNSVVCPQEGKTMGVHFLQHYQRISADEYYRVLCRHAEERCGVDVHAIAGDKTAEIPSPQPANESFTDAGMPAPAQNETESKSTIMKWKTKLPQGLMQKLLGSIWLTVTYRIGIALFFALLGRHLWQLGIELIDKVFFTLFWLLLFNLFLGFGQEENRVRCSWAFLARPEWLLGMTILLLLYGLLRIVPLLKKVPLLWM